MDLDVGGGNGGFVPAGEAQAAAHWDPHSKAAARFTHAFVGGLSMMIVSEIGDKTFFIAAIMAMRHPRFIVLAGAAVALIIMTVLSAYIGSLATIIPRHYTNMIATLLFVFFGLRLLKEGYSMAPDEAAEELEEVTQELKEKEDKLSASEQQPKPWSKIVSPVFVQAFVLTFLAEWGDRSQIATIILGARENTLGVALGASLGHVLCTFIAVVGGRLLAQRISVRTVTLIGGVVFLLFALTSFIMDSAGSDDDDSGLGSFFKQQQQEDQQPPIVVN
ncbi:transmembrane protein [Salpingoeca rosetta]|uniref:GDT1 family protein n=1 Tax=Salpingoeca rosetta (strain ATCC 50818 / BSB-021) TaxID=946362 RepID=F2TWA0_SALR5|nr:uncharacterized protein PTSG_00368 [Salpingoeca rosetta]EGD72346.1 transmembrane protein [Salpingoeca rosetta]|eukprot:XP_004998916.1 transmembrane protein [Salpingoeca rosetta]